MLSVLLNGAASLYNLHLEEPLTILKMVLRLAFLLAGITVLLVAGAMLPERGSRPSGWLAYVWWPGVVDSTSTAIVVRDMVSGHELRVSGTLSANPFAPLSWSPDGRLAFSARTDPNLPGSDLYLWDWRTGAITLIYDAGEYDTTPEWIDSERLMVVEGYFTLDLRVKVLNVATGTVQDISLDRSSLTAAPSRDGRVAFVSNTDDHIFTIKVADLATGEVTNITETPAMLSSPNWSPDGRLVFMLKQEDWDLYVIDPTTRITTQITDLETWDTNPVWSADGRIAYERSLSPYNSQLLVLDVASGTTVEVTKADAGIVGKPVWLPDGRLAYTATDDGEFVDMHMYDFNTQTTTRVTNTPSISEFYPAWMP